MATIVRTQDGSYFEIDEKTLKRFQIKAEKVPPSQRIPDLLSAPASSGSAGPVQIIIRLPAGATVTSGSEVGGRMDGNFPVNLNEPARYGCSSNCCGVRG